MQERRTLLEMEDSDFGGGSLSAKELCSSTDANGSAQFGIVRGRVLPS
jgi:hypothetical protein